MNYLGNAEPVQIAGQKFVLAAEAIDQANVQREIEMARRGADGFSFPDAPDTDWAGVGLLWLATVQLDEAVELIARLLGVSLDELVDLDVERGLDEVRQKFEQLLDPDDALEDGRLPSEWADEIVEVLNLWSALRGQAKRRIGLAWAYRGELTLVTGPELPTCPVLGVEGSDSELVDDPAHIFAIAAQVTQSVATHLVAIESARPSVRDHG